MHSSPPALRILLAEDNADLATALSALIDLQPDLRFVGQAADGAELLALAAGVACDVVVLDLTLRDGPALPHVTRLRALQPDCRIVAFTGLGADEGELDAACRAAGCDASLRKDGHPGAFFAGLRALRDR